MNWNRNFHYTHQDIFYSWKRDSKTNPKDEFLPILHPHGYTKEKFLERQEQRVNRALSQSFVELKSN